MEQVCICERGLAWIEQNKVYGAKDMNLQGLAEGKAGIEALLRSGKATQAEVAAATRKYAEKNQAADAERAAVLQAWSKANPGKSTMEYGGKETQEFYDKVAAKPPSAAAAAIDKRTCSWCGASSGTQKLLACAACHTAYYCGKTCQKAAWKGHKAACKEARAADDAAPPKKKKLPLSWAQLEDFGYGVPAKGKTLEIRAMTDESFMRQVFQCKDRLGVVKRIAAYTSEMRIPGLAAGKVVRWKNPRFHYFSDGSSGCRIEDGDLGDITVSDN